ncbi:MAG: hypothetical protein IKA64_00260 [Clostridia bacterium]|nr:hypothetical protein [Clostridia bacterium]
MFFVNCDSYEGLPPRLYRSPEEIARDICEIKKKIERTSERLNVRNILTEMLSECAAGEPESFISRLEELVDGAHEALSRLRRLEDSLGLLTDELHEVRRILG